MLQMAFREVYRKFKLHFYEAVFRGFEMREATLTTVETFCMEIIYAMNRPTVAKFARITNISSPNAAYRINQLVKKGYLRRVRSEEDRREYHLEVTDKYLRYYNISNNYMNTVMKRIEERFTPEEIQTLEKILEVTSSELMPEVQAGDAAPSPDEDAGG
jgi:DNA-binding MarR family transcriptional regulator